MHLIRTISSFVALPILFVTLFGLGSHEGLFDAYRRWQESKAIYNVTLARNDELRAERDRYARMAEKLQSDPLEKEWLVRSYGYIKPGETAYRIVRPSDAPRDNSVNVHMGAIGGGDLK